MIIEPRSSVPIEITPGAIGNKNKVAVYGAVQTPGIYEYEGSIRVEDAVALAGGLAEDADAAFSNLTGWVNDGETILIPTSGFPEPTLTIQVQEEVKINLNTADKNELMSLPGIGEKRAAEIMKLRENKGKITYKEELLEIQGISEKLLESIYDRLIVD
ncbi:MAG: helix-hairpin-helix domain-containing protein [Flexilinea sp.]|nr:helix-hairpin-helix domain-containing protein [Flexilinea sp.]